jgi:hypothetical protein
MEGTTWEAQAWIGANNESALERQVLRVLAGFSWTQSKVQLKFSLCLTNEALRHEDRFTLGERTPR